VLRQAAELASNKTRQRNWRQEIVNASLDKSPQALDSHQEGCRRKIILLHGIEQDRKSEISGFWNVGDPQTISSFETVELKLP
jgi:hypothetical protein